MEFLKEWSFCVCLSLICAVILSLFTPEGRMKSFYKMLISVFVFVSFLYPFKDVKSFDFNFDSLKDNVSLSENINTSYENMINKKISDVLSENGIKSASVSSDISVNAETSEIEIVRVSIAVSDEYDKEKVKNIVFEKLGIIAEVRGLGE